MSPEQQQNNFEASCGTEILRDTSRIRIPWQKRVWLARGEIMDKFDNEVMPKIEALLQNEAPRYADYYFSVVMLGKRQENAKPKILVSCTNRDVRTEILRIVKGSKHIRDAYPEFGFGESVIPVHESVASVPLAGEVKSNFRADPPDTPASIDAPLVESALCNEVLASVHNPLIGRKLFFLSTTTTATTTNSELARYATGGIVVCIGKKYYQKTVGHISESETITTPSWPGEDIDYCRFDDDSDDEDDDALQHDCDIMSRGSITPEDNHSSTGSESNSAVSGRASISMTADLSSSPGPCHHATSESDNIVDIMHQSSQSIEAKELLHGLQSVGRLQHGSRTGETPGLDYALVLLDAVPNPEKVNEICLNSITKKYLQIQGVEAVPAVEREVITVTASEGITHGKLLPSAVYFRAPQQKSLQKLYIVHLSKTVVDGDCGADVVDAETGSVYGHIIRGCRGTPIAYIVSAKQVFEDIKQRVGIMPVIALSETPASTRRSDHLGSHQSDSPSSRLGVFSSSRPNGSYSSYSDSGNYVPPGDPHEGVYRELDPREDRSYRFAAHVLTDPFTGFGNKKSNRHSNNTASKRGHGNGSQGSSSSSTSSRDSGYSSASSRSQQQQQAQYQQQQFQQQQQRYPGPQHGYRPAGGPGYGRGYGPGYRSGMQQQQPDIYARGQQQRSGIWDSQNTTDILFKD